MKIYFGFFLSLCGALLFVFSVTWWFDVYASFFQPIVHSSLDGRLLFLLLFFFFGGILLAAIGLNMSQDSKSS